MSASVRRLLDLSTDHLPEALRCDLGEWNAVAYPIEGSDGPSFLLWVPNDPKESSSVQEDAVHPVILAIQQRARALDCDYVLFDHDADWDAVLPTFQVE